MTEILHIEILRKHGHTDMGITIPHPPPMGGEVITLLWRLITCRAFAITRSMLDVGRSSSPEVACWTSDHWVGGSSPLRDMVHNSFLLIWPCVCISFQSIQGNQRWQTSPAAPPGGLGHCQTGMCMSNFMMIG